MCSVKKCVHKNFANFTGKHFIKKRPQYRRLPVKFVKFLRTPILKKISERLLPCVKCPPSLRFFPELMSHQKPEFES